MSKKFGVQNFVLVQQNFGSKQFWVQEHFRSIKILSLKKIESTKILGTKMIWLQIFFGVNKVFGLKKIFGPKRLQFKKNIWVEKKFFVKKKWPKTSVLHHI